MKQSIITKFSSLLLFLLLGTSTFAQKRENDLDRFFSALYQTQQFNGNVLIAEKGRIIYQGAFGYADFQNKRPNNERSSFPIASITKTITATAILQLKEKGKLKIDDEVTKYLPNFPYPNITIRHLLSHSSGLPDYDDLFLSHISSQPDMVFTNADIIPTIAALKKPLIFEPGEDFAYNNVNFNILALIVEKVSGMPFGIYLSKFIFQPAGMKNTSLGKFFSRKDKELSLLYRFPYSYSNTIEHVDTVPMFRPNYHNFGFSGHGDVISTTTDLLNYDKALYNGVLLNQASLKEAFTPTKFKNGNDNPQKYGLGWRTEQDSTVGNLVMHEGSLPGGRSILLRNISKHQTIILFDNTQTYVTPIAYGALKILNGETVPTPKKSAARIYGRVLTTKGLDEGRKVLERLKSDSDTFAISESEFNTMAYEMMGNNKDEEALEVFKANVALFPDSWNVYDSYGEALLKTGKRDEAIKMYKKSMALNPENQNGKKILEQLLNTNNK